MALCGSFSERCVGERLRARLCYCEHCEGGCATAAALLFLYLPLVLFLPPPPAPGCGRQTGTDCCVLRREHSRGVVGYVTIGAVKNKARWRSYARHGGPRPGWGGGHAVLCRVLLSRHSSPTPLKMTNVLINCFPMLATAAWCSQKHRVGSSSPAGF